jgi:hypothetical protein
MNKDRGIRNKQRGRSVEDIDQIARGLGVRKGEEF